MKQNARRVRSEAGRNYAISPLAATNKTTRSHLAKRKLRIDWLPDYDNQTHARWMRSQPDAFSDLSKPNSRALSVLLGSIHKLYLMAANLDKKPVVLPKSFRERLKSLKTCRKKIVALQDDFRRLQRVHRLNVELFKTFQQILQSYDLLEQELRPLLTLPSEDLPEYVLEIWPDLHGARRMTGTSFLKMCPFGTQDATYFTLYEFYLNSTKSKRVSRAAIRRRIAKLGNTKESAVRTAIGRFKKRKHDVRKVRGMLRNLRQYR